jgi:hypothetical protein
MGTKVECACTKVHGLGDLGLRQAALPGLQSQAVHFPILVCVIVRNKKGLAPNWRKWVEST